MTPSEIYFDTRDRDMLAMVNGILNAPPRKTQQGLFNAHLHPHGIKEMAASRVWRVAHAVINLLTRLEAGQENERLQALQALYDETLSSAQTTLRRNTARVLLQIMKEMVRAHGHEEQQLKLAHDFRKAAQGTPRIVRTMLAHYHLPEMPEEWNQLAFDDHVYDANTKGRKTPTHLIMDAWIKGLRSLTVVYYNHVNIAAAREILEAASIMGIQIRIGLEFRALFRERFITLQWIPRGFTASTDFLTFLGSQPVQELMHQGQAASQWQQTKITHMLTFWNTTLRPEIAARWEQPLAPLSIETFLDFVGPGQASRIHLAECLHKHLQPAMLHRAEILRKRCALPEQAEAQKAEQELAMLDSLTYETILEDWLSPEKQPDLQLPGKPTLDGTMPPLLHKSPRDLVSWLMELHSGYRLVLNLADLTAEDVLELLWDCKGAITHLEILNIKHWHEGRFSNIGSINALQQALATGQGPYIKQTVRHMIRGMEKANHLERAEKFRKILHDIPTLWEHYRKIPLKTRMGSNSASRTARSFGMGLVYRETLPPRARKALQGTSRHQNALPFYTPLEEHVRYYESEPPTKITRILRRVPGLGNLGKTRRREWTAGPVSTVCDQGNISNLGGLSLQKDNGLRREQTHNGAQPGLRYLRDSWMNALKVFIGFVPAFFSFYATQEWWFLAWFGTLIWFGITGVRNILQMVVAGQGISRGTLLQWKDHVCINRLCDSLMYTGISVLLLEVMVRVWLLEHGLGISIREQPGMVFTILNVINGFYICAHNVYRGFPKTAAIGNLFRSALAIPVSTLYNFGLLHFLMTLGVHDPLLYLVPSAAIVSKLASDSVAAIIEGYADSQNNRRMRRWDYAGKLRQVFRCYTRLELLFPERDVLIHMARSKGLPKPLAEKGKALEQNLIINALDLMYFWYYQPRAQDTLRHLVQAMSDADRTVFLRSQLVLTRHREIAQCILDGMLGDNFSKALAFYLNSYKAYLQAMSELWHSESSGRKSGEPAFPRNEHFIRQSTLSD